MCCKSGDVVIFLAGAELFHTLAHVMMSYCMTFPIDMKMVVMTSTMNNYAIVGNAVVTILLLLLARRLRCRCVEECKVEAKEDRKAERRKTNKK